MNQPAYDANLEGVQGAIREVLGQLLTRGVDPARAKHLSHRHRADALSSTTNEVWATRLAAADLIEHYARRAAARSFLTGVPGGLMAIPLALVEAQGAFSARLELALALQLLVDASFTETADWRMRVLTETFELNEATVHGTRSAALRAAREVALSRGLRFVTRRIGGRFIPVVGGAFSAAMTYGWLHREGRRLAEHIKSLDN